MFAFGGSSCWRKPEYPEETLMSDLVTTRKGNKGKKRKQLRRKEKLEK